MHHVGGPRYKTPMKEAPYQNSKGTFTYLIFDGDLIFDVIFSIRIHLMSAKRICHVHIRWGLLVKSSYPLPPTLIILPNRIVLNSLELRLKVHIIRNVFHSFVFESRRPNEFLPDFPLEIPGLATPKPT